jgi:hypothetical protein
MDPRLELDPSLQKILDPRLQGELLFGDNIYIFIGVQPRIFRYQRTAEIRGCLSGCTEALHVPASSQNHYAWHTLADFRQICIAQHKTNITATKPY